MCKKSLLVFLLLPILLYAQLNNVPYAVWNDPASGTSTEPIYSSASTSSTQITTLGLSDYLVAKNFVQNGRDWFQVDLPSTTGNAITGYCAAWYGPSPFTFRTLPNCNKQILTVTATVLNVRNTTNTTGFVTIGGANCQVFSGQKFVYTGNAPITANGYTWYEIYLPDNCSQSIGYLANVSNSSIQISSSNTQVLPQITVNQPSASDITSTSITLNWNTISGISSYTINYNGTTVNATSSPYTLSSLTSNTSYNISVSYNFPYNQSCSSTQSNTISVSTTNGCSTPNASFILPSAGLVNTPLQITNTSTGTNPLSYQWTSTPSSGVQFSPNNSATNPSITFTTAGSYTISVTVSNSCGFNSNQGVTTISNTCTPPTTPSSASATYASINSGQTDTLKVNGGALNSATDWVWFTGSCGGTFVGTGATLPVMPTTTTTYYVNASACGTTTSCKSVTINVNNNPSPTVTLTYPNGGETWFVGNSTPQAISAFVSNGYPVNWKYYISYNGGANWTLFKQTYLNGQTYNVYSFVPLQTSSTAKIRIEVDLSNGQTISDVSNNLFSIITPSNGYSFQLANNPNAISHLYWPFPNSSWNDDPYHIDRDKWIGGFEDGTFGGSGFGEAGHLNCDYYAQDWNQRGLIGFIGNLDCGKPFYSPLDGKVIAYRNSCHYNACDYDSFTCNNYGNSVFIQSLLDTNFVFLVTHLQDNVALTTIGHTVNVGDLIGYIGTTGASKSSHAHCSLYKNVYQNFTFGTMTKPAIRWMKENINSPYSGSFPVSANNFSADFRFDAVLGGAGGVSTPFLPLNISNNATICKGGSITVTAPLGSSYQWSTGETTSSISVSQAGNYFVEVTQQNGDVINYYQTINVIDSTSINVYASESLCPNDTILLSCLSTIEQEFPTDNFNHYLWSNGSQSPYIEVTQSGIYTLTFTDGNNCFTTVKSITVNQAQSPNQPTISNNSGNLASSSINGCTYQWFLNGNQVGIGQYLNADTIGSGYYTVQATNQNGCSSLSNPLYIQNTGISELYDETVLIYPNPASNLLNIRLLESVDIHKFEIKNSLGQNLIQGDLNNSNITSVDISRLVSGVYLIQLTKGSTIYNYRFLKE